MLSLAGVLIMTALELSYVPQVSIGIIWSERLFTVHFVILSTCMYVTSSTRTKLANGKLQVAGDQWPIFLYANYCNRSVFFFSFLFLI